MKIVIVESPYAGDVERNLRYVRAAMRDCLLRGEAPFASHALYTQPGVLDDNKPDERDMGIAAGLAIGAKADATVVYTDLGLSKGMILGIARAELEGRPIERRMLGAEWENPAARVCSCSGHRHIQMGGQCAWVGDGKGERCPCRVAPPAPKSRILL
jgi:hypothetical protein